VAPRPGESTTPKLLRWFDRHNEEKPYRERVKPFGFLLAYQTGALPFAGDHLPRSVSVYDGHVGIAAEAYFDREIGEPVPRGQLKSYHEALAPYHMHPESIFHGGDYTDRGFTRMRHVRATVTEYSGKEANRWEEKIHLGLDIEAQTEYGVTPSDRERIFKLVRRAGEGFGQRRLASASDTSLSVVSAILCGKCRPNAATLAKLYQALPRPERVASEEAQLAREVLGTVKRRCQPIGVRRFARYAEVDGANLTKILSGRRTPSRAMLAKLEAALTQGPDY
jgi:transcriptional regulator with XRE-family HTH domain